MPFAVFADADYASKVTCRRSTSGVAVMLGGVAVCTNSRTQHYVIFSTTEAENVAMSEGSKEGLFVRSVRSVMQPRVALAIELFEENEGGIVVVENRLSSGWSKHIYVRWRLIQNMVKPKAITVAHVESGWQCGDILPKALSMSLFKSHRKGLMNLCGGK